MTHDTDGDFWTLTGKSGSVSCGVTASFPWVLVHTVLFVPSKSLFPQSCVSSGSTVVGLLATSSKRAYVMPRSAAPKALSLSQATASLHLLRRHSSVSVSAGSLGPGAHKVCLSPLSVSGGDGV